MSTADSEVPGAAIFPRVQPPPHLDESMRAFLRTTKFYDQGRPLNAHQVLSNHPRAGRALNRWLDWDDDAVLTSRERRALILRTSALTKCRYEWSVHSQQGVTSGDLISAEVEDLASGSLNGPTWSPRERSLIEVCEAVCASDTLADDQWLSAAQVLNAQELIEGLCVIGYYRMCCAMMNALGVPDEGPLTVAAQASDHEKVRSR